jgi:hypothetical protein
MHVQTAGVEGAGFKNANVAHRVLENSLDVRAHSRKFVVMSKWRIWAR